ncbi:hypothetical protein Pint_33134 [Pistacia integerrima]|uniref:Uncharacterized protein n=1 Tax=Pistacia integerrima TaxID=434235 RepID=A0ACC0X9X0_9ROSI|nr:hypothetical protein Pint_33134 [Pistacia integerrima]
MHPPLTLHRDPMCAEKVVKRKVNFEESKKLRERLQALRKENAEAEA